MADYTRDEAARRAGVTAEALDRMVEAGVLVPADGDRFTAGHVRRASLVHGLVDSGIPLDGLAAALRDGTLSLDFLDSPAYERITALTTVTFAELAEQTAVPVHLLTVVREAVGGAAAGPDDLVREGEMAIVPFVTLLATEGYDPTGIERLLRTQGESLRRLVEAESEWWETNVVVPRLRAGLSATEIPNPELSDRLAPLLEQAVLANYRTQQGHVWASSVIVGFQAILDRAGLGSTLDRPPAICFFDLTGYTALTAERGDEAAAELAASLSRLVHRTSVARGGRPVKWLGDGVMLWFRDPGPGVVAALEMCDGVREAGLPPAHVGLHAGPVIAQGGDYYGQTVNVAARIAEYARPGEVLVSAAVVQAAPDTPGLAYADIGPVELKGVGVPVHLHSVRRREP